MNGKMTIATFPTFPVTKQTYTQTIHLMNKLTRSFLESIKNALAAMPISDITPVQAMIVYNIGNNTISIRDVIKNEYYQGENANYNLTKLFDNGYVHRTTNEFDMRSVLISLTDKGTDLRKNLDSVIMSQADKLTSVGMDDNGMRAMMGILSKIDANLKAEGKR